MKTSPLFVLFTFIISLTFTQISAQYISSTTVQVGPPSIYPGQLTQSILRIEIEIGNNPVTLTNMEFNTGGSTFPMNDIVRAQLWQYNDTAILNTIFGLLIGTFNGPGASNWGFLTAPNANYSGMSSYSGMTPAKKNYFWLAFDIANGAVLCDSIDGEFLEFKADGVVQFPSVSAPAGYRVVGICPTGLEENPYLPEIKTSPQPFHDNLRVTLNSGKSEFVIMELFNMDGQKVTSLFKGMTTGPFMEFNFSLAPVPPGMYYLNTIFNNGVKTEKIIKM